MSQQDFDVVAIGNAIVDVLAKSDDAFLAKHKLAKGTMTLVDASTSAHLYSQMPPAIECSGGSAANTVVGVAHAEVRIAPAALLQGDARLRPTLTREQATAAPQAVRAGEATLR